VALLVWSVGWSKLQIKVLDHCSSAPSFWPFCTDVPAQTSEQKPYRAFGIIEEGNLLNNFGIQSLEHFCLQIVRKLILNQAL
jgi:hypothetical protein